MRTRRTRPFLFVLSAVVVLVGSISLVNLVSGTSVPPAQAACGAPSDVMDLTGWKVTLPTGADEPDEIEQPELTGFSADPWFVPTEDCSGIRFRSAVNGVTTANSKNPRSELREMIEDGSNEAEWSTSAGTSTMTVRGMVTHLPAEKPHVVAAQVHGGSDDLTAFRLEGSSFWVTNGDETHHQLITDSYELGTPYELKFVAGGGQIEAYFDGQLVTTIPADSSTAYFKTGAYTQAHCENSSPCDETNYGETVLCAVDVTHEGAPAGPTDDEERARSDSGDDSSDESSEESSSSSDSEESEAGEESEASDSSSASDSEASASDDDGEGPSSASEASASGDESSASASSSDDEESEASGWSSFQSQEGETGDDSESDDSSSSSEGEESEGDSGSGSSSTEGEEESGDDSSSSSGGGESESDSGSSSEGEESEAGESSGEDSGSSSSEGEESESSGEDSGSSSTSTTSSGSGGGDSGASCGGGGSDDQSPDCTTSTTASDPVETTTTSTTQPAPDDDSGDDEESDEESDDEEPEEEEEESDDDSGDEADSDDEVDPDSDYDRPTAPPSGPLPGNPDLTGFAGSAGYPVQESDSGEASEDSADEASGEDEAAGEEAEGSDSSGEDSTGEDSGGEESESGDSSESGSSEEDSSSESEAGESSTDAEQGSDEAEDSTSAGETGGTDDAGDAEAESGDSGGSTDDPPGCPGSEDTTTTEPEPAEPDDDTTTTTAPSSSAPVGGPGRIAYQADGNAHDPDDHASAGMVLAILAAEGLQENLVNYNYNNHISEWGETDSGMVATMTESVMGSAERFGFDSSLFFDASTDQGLADGVAALTAEINASTADNPLTIALAGPMETVWMALDAADPEARAHVRCVSHGDGSHNQTHGAEHGGHTYDDVIELGCQRVQIPDQNGNLGPTDMGDWSYLNESGDPNLAWLYERLEAAGGVGDVSDAGMVYFAITGNEEPTRDDFRSALTGGGATGGDTTGGSGSSDSEGSGDESASESDSEGSGGESADESDSEGSESDA